MKKQDVAKEVFRRLGIHWNPNKHGSTGATVTKAAWQSVLDALNQNRGQK